MALYVLRNEYYRTHHFTDNDVITTMTGIRLPDFKIVDYTKGRRAFTGDFEDNVKIHFKEDIPLSTFVALDSIIKLERSNWRKAKDGYAYNVIWGGIYPAPPGEHDEDSGFFTIVIKKGSKNGEIVYGVW